MDLPLPDRPWDLSAPESLALLWGPDTSDTWTVSVGILELAVRQGLSLRVVRDRRLGIFPRTRLILSGRVDASTIRSEPIDAVWRVRPDSRSFRGGVSGIPVAALAERLVTPAAARHASPLGTFRPGSVYVREYILPSLRRRGICNATVLDRFTPHGLERLEELRQLMDFGRSVAAAADDTDPGTALAYVERAGSSVLLVRGLAPVLSRLMSRYGGMPHRPLASQAPAPDGLMDPIPAAALARVIGPDAGDDVDMALYAITTEVQRQWAASYRRWTAAFGTGE